MANLKGMKDKFIILKNEDLIGALQSEDELRASFKHSLFKVALHRQKQGKKTDNQYLVINTDEPEPYADEVIEILKRYGHWG
jgi:hypothetical protein